VASNYKAISEENRRRYGTDIGRIGPMLLADRYDDRTHFIFELLQNAEDALGRRGDWPGPRKVTFELTSTHLSLSHFGRPFDEADVRGVCGIAESTKDKFSIGRFGIGFKSVYTFTDRPEIHSGDEDFAVANYVQPQRADRGDRKNDETQIFLPLKTDDTTAQKEITAGFQHLGPGALLFLRYIEEISWSVEGGASGFYLRNSPETFGENVQRITVIGQESGKAEVDQDWLVFHRDVFSNTQEKVGRVEVAFLLVATKDAPGDWSVQPVAASPLVVFFPTVVPTNLGFLVQGPYRTTPSRDNVPRGEPWNQHLVKETSSLLVEAMRWMRDQAMLDTSALRCLPLDREMFPEGAMFAPIFETVRQALLDEPLLPRFGGGFVPASQAKLARTQELRELLSPEQIEALFASEASAWLTGDITVDKEPELRTYLMQELGITEVTPATLIPRLTKAFLESQPDDWTLQLYEFLSGQEATLRRRLDTIPLIRLDNGTHVVAHQNGEAQAFLPGTIKTSFPTIRRAVCETVEARSFLISLGITEPDPVDDVIWNLLPKYRLDEVDVADDIYATDIERIRAAFNTDSKTQREKLLTALRETSFVKVVDTCDGKNYVAKPINIYIATDRLKQLFAGVPDVLIVDDGYPCLRGEEMRELLEACGALRYPRPEKAPDEPIWSDRLKALRVRAGHAETSGYSDRVEDWTLQGFEALLQQLSKFAPEQRVVRARLIWESLGDLEERRGQGIFDGSYAWSHNGKYDRSFPAAFLRKLNTAAWVPDANGVLVTPNLVVFDALGWKTNPFLLTKISFKPPIIDQLAREAGIDPAALDLLRKLGITSLADLTTRLGITNLPTGNQRASDDNPTEEASLHQESDSTVLAGDIIYDAARDLLEDDMRDIPPGTFDLDGARGGSQGVTLARETPHGVGQGNGEARGALDVHTGGGDKRVGTSGGEGKRTPGQAGGRPFISYLGSHPETEESDPDGLDQVTRMKIEDQAITLIISLEPELKRTPAGNPGFDLFEASKDGQQIRWIEVKSMTGSLENRPVGISRKQFEYARTKGDAFWLYVVEYATDPVKARVLRIQNPIAHAQTFTFDQGWSHIALTEPPGTQALPERQLEDNTCESARD
jgi:hypothetical protein